MPKASTRPTMTWVDTAPEDLDSDQRRLPGGTFAPITQCGTRLIEGLIEDTEEKLAPKKLTSKLERLAGMPFCPVEIDRHRCSVDRVALELCYLVQNMAPKQPATINAFTLRYLVLAEAMKEMLEVLTQAEAGSVEFECCLTRINGWFLHQITQPLPDLVHGPSRKRNALWSRKGAVNLLSLSRSNYEHPAADAVATQAAAADASTPRLDSWQRSVPFSADRIRALRAKSATIAPEDPRTLEKIAQQSRRVSSAVADVWEQSMTSSRRLACARPASAPSSTARRGRPLRAQPPPSSTAEAAPPPPSTLAGGVGGRGAPTGSVNPSGGAPRRPVATVRPANKPRSKVVMVRDHSTGEVLTYREPGAVQVWDAARLLRKDSVQTSFATTGDLLDQCDQGFVDLPEGSIERRLVRLMREQGFQRSGASANSFVVEIESQSTSRLASQHAENMTEILGVVGSNVHNMPKVIRALHHPEDRPTAECLSRMPLADDRLLVDPFPQDAGGKKKKKGGKKGKKGKKK